LTTTTSHERNARGGRSAHASDAEFVLWNCEKLGGGRKTSVVLEDRARRRTRVAGMLAAQLRAGDAVVVRVQDAAGHEATIDAIVVRPTQIGRGGDATVNVELQLPGGQTELREVRATDLLLPRRRVAPKRKLGDADGWGEGAARVWASSCGEGSTIVEDAPQVSAARGCSLHTCRVMLSVRARLRMNVLIYACDACT
jgi:translation initiation factor IF-1